MTHSLDLGPEAGINARMAVLRALDRATAPLPAGEPLVPGVFFNTDPEAPTGIAIESRPGALMRAEFTVPAGARWLALHIALEECDLSGRMMFGLVCRSAAPQSTTFRPCLRTGTAEGFRDIFFRKTAIAYAEPSLHLDALVIDDHPDLAAPAPWRELVLFFRPETATIDLQDLRVFVI